nr:hypothetical protein [uncultured Roseococcus sp.]
MSAPPLPSLPADWTYGQALECDAAIQAHMATHGFSAEAISALAQVRLGRCAYQSAVAALEEGLSRWPDINQPYLGVSGRLLVIAAAIHGGRQGEAERWVADLARHPVVWPYAADPILRHVRGTGLQDAARDLLAGCLPHLDPDTPLAQQATTLLRGYDEALAVASKVRLISLGSGCYPWMQPNRYMLRHVDAVDALMPFNMSVTVESSIVLALEDGFSAFFDAAAFDRTTITRGIPVGRIRRYAMLFNHDCDEDFLRDGMAELRARCARRAHNFLAEACTGPRVFLCVLPEVTDLHRLETALAGLMRDEAYRLLVLLTSPSEKPGLPAPRLPTTRVVPLPVPSPSYNWTLEDGTPEGIRYDLAMRQTVLDTMRELA